MEAVGGQQLRHGGGHGPGGGDDGRIRDQPARGNVALGGQLFALEPEFAGRGQLAAVVSAWGLPPLGVVAAILLFYVVLGAVMDELSMILLTIPIFLPMVLGLDFGMPKEMVAIWFGVMVLMTVGFGMLAPPVGLNVYVVNGMARDVPVAESYRGVMPFLATDTLRTLLLLFFHGGALGLIAGLLHLGIFGV